MGAAGAGGTVTNFSAGDLSPLFTTNEATPTTTPALTFTLSNFAAHTFYGNPTGSTGPPAANAIGEADVTNLISDLTAKASSATTLAGYGIIDAVSNTRTVNSHALSADVTVSAGDVGNSMAQWNANQINSVSLSSLATGILKNTTGTGVPSIAVAGDFPTLNQNTTGTAATATALAANGANCSTGMAPLGVDASGNSEGCFTPAGTGTVTSAGLTVNGTSPSGIFTVTGSPVTGAGTLNFNLVGTSGGIPYFSSSTVISSSGALAANGVVLGGGAGAAPTVTTADSTTTHALMATAGAPAFRALVAGDIPAIAESGVTNLVSDLALKAPLASPSFTGLATFGGNADIQSNAYLQQVANDTGTGTTVNKLAKLSGAPSKAVILTTADLLGVMGIVVSGAGTSGSASVAIGGQASCVFDGATTANNYVQASATVAGDCHDAGAVYPTANDVVGRVLSTNGSGGTYAMVVYGPGSKDATSGAGAAFSAVTTGTNAAALHMGTGGSLDATGTGTIAATVINASGKIVDLNTIGADPTGAVAADSFLVTAHDSFNGLAGGTITGCGTYKLTSTFLITNPGLRFENNCGGGGSAHYSPAQRGKFVFTSTTNSAIPNPAIGPELTTTTTGGSLAATTTYYIKSTYVNGFGETLPSPAVSIATGAGATNSITVKLVEYQSGGWGANIYCSTDNITFRLQPAGNFNGSGTYVGPPHIVAPGSSTFPVLNTCTTGSGVTPPGSNTSTHAMVLVQVGTGGSGGTGVTAGPVFNNVSFYDSTGVLGGGLVIANAQRTECNHCSFDGFTANGSATGGAIPFEQGGIGYAVLSAGTSTPSSNYNSLFEPIFYNNTLGIYQLGQDTTIWGGSIVSTVGQVGYDEPWAGTARIYGAHFAPFGASAKNFMIFRGGTASKYGGIVSVKTESLDRLTGGGAILLYKVHNRIIDIECSSGTTAATACIQIDAGSGQNIFRISPQLTQPPFSDGSTSFVDPSNANQITWSGSTPGAIFNGLVLPNPSSTTLGGIESLVAVTSKWINAISTAGVPTATQPAFSDLIGSATCAQLPALTGDVTSGAGSCATTFKTSPSFTTPVLGVATGTSLAATSFLSTGTAPSCTAGTGGAWCAGEGTTPTAASAVGDIYQDSALHDWATNSNGGGNGILHHTSPAPIRSVGLTAAVSTATLCASTAGACNQAGHYAVNWTFYEAGTACATPGTGGVTFLLTWTDGNGTAHSAVSLPMDDAASLVATSGTFHFQTTLAAAWASGNFNIDTNGSIIQYATGYTACTSGTGTYALSVSVARMQ